MPRHLQAARRLPRLPSLDQLRKQAKDLLAEYRAGDPAARIDVRDELLQSTPLGWACRWGGES